MLRTWETAVSSCYDIFKAYHTFNFKLSYIFYLVCTAKFNSAPILVLYFICTIEVVNMAIEHEFQEGWIKFRFDFLIFFHAVDHVCNIGKCTFMMDEAHEHYIVSYCFYSTSHERIIVVRLYVQIFRLSYIHKP